MRRSEDRIPKAVYYQCIWLIKDMDRLRRLEAVGNYIDEDDGLVFFVDDNNIIRNAEVIDQAVWKLECVRKALEEVPPEYRQSTLDCITYNVPFGDMAHENTWRRWRQIFIRELAKNLMLM